jgi:hypothetical protein
MTAKREYRKISVDECPQCGRLAEVFVDVKLEIAEIDDGVKEVVAEALLPGWLGKGEWVDMSVVGMDGLWTFTADCAATIQPALRLPKILENCDYPWTLVITMVGSGTERRFGGLGV